MYDIEEKNQVVVGNDNKNDGDMRSNRSVRNAEIPEKEIISKNESKNPVMLSIMLWISNTVPLMFFSIFVTFIVTRNIKWLYILLSVFIIVTCVEILKVILMRYDADFLYRPSNCIGGKSMLDMLFYNNFIFDQILKKIDINEYEKRGFPSMHMTSGVSILTMMYLFFPKYSRITLMVAPIYTILLGYSRIYLDCHTWLQVIFGTIMGFSGGKLMYNIFK